MRRDGTRHRRAVIARVRDPVLQCAASLLSSSGGREVAAGEVSVRISRSRSTAVESTFSRARVCGRALAGGGLASRDETGG